MNKVIASVILSALFFFFASPCSVNLSKSTVYLSAVYAQQEIPFDNSNKTTVQDDQEDQSVLYSVMAVIVVLWLGIFTYMVKLDRQVKKLKRKL
ncbi:MAG TPA: CcmD family protein [Spirochaetota bacterium]|nr:CcmD family protein [Spirochaetota bacterium]HPI89536.1 CcmD family protein [Spirochaetota bacterium]HPR49000.1 CcmD family protein [Spirochaetota bacterium]